MHLFRRFIATPYLAPEDGAMSGGADPDGAGNDGTDAGDGADVATGTDDGSDSEGVDAADAGARDEDEDDLVAGPDEDDDAASLSAEERHQRLLKKLRKTKRQLLKTRTIRDRLKGVDLDAVMANARNYEALIQRVQRNPKLRRAILEGDDSLVDEGGSGGTRSGRDRTESRTARAGRLEVPTFDEANVPWDTTNASGKHFVQEAKHVRALTSTVNQLLDRIEQLEGGHQQVRTTIQQRDRQAIQSRWKDGLDAAAKTIADKNQKTVLTDLVTAAFHAAPGADPQKVITHYLNLLGIKPQQKRIAAAAAQQRMAQGNGQLPRHQAGGGTATPAKGKALSLAEVHRKIRGFRPSA